MRAYVVKGNRIFYSCSERNKHKAENFADKEQEATVVIANSEEEAILLAYKQILEINQCVFGVK